MVESLVQLINLREARTMLVVLVDCLSLRRNLGLRRYSCPPLVGIFQMEKRLVLL